MKPKRLLSLVAALGLFAALIPLTTGVALAWSPPAIASVCSSDEAVHNWTVTLATESNYNIDWADNSSYTSATSVLMHVGANSLSTPSSVTTLNVRWSSDHNSKSSAAWAGGACSSPSPSQTAFQSFQGETATPTTDPSESAPPSSPPSATPFESFQGETATPVITGTPCVVGVEGPDAVVTLPPCSTPFESFQGETAFPSQTTTPPPTSTTGDGSSGTATPLLALLLCLALGGLGLITAQAQRRSIRP